MMYQIMFYSIHSLILCALEQRTQKMLDQWACALHNVQFIQAQSLQNFINPFNSTRFGGFAKSILISIFNHSVKAICLTTKKMFVI